MPGDWYCPECGDFIPSSQVTYEEVHDLCGSEVLWFEYCDDGGDIDEEVSIINVSGVSMLCYNGKIWMSDTSRDVEEQRELANSAYGDVLVAGYGLGIIHDELGNNNRVNSITTVEINVDVILKVLEWKGEIVGDIVICDFFKYNPDRKFDCIIGDMWADVTYEYIDMYNRFMQKARGMLAPDGIILAWKGNLFQHL